MNLALLDPFKQSAESIVCCQSQLYPTTSPSLRALESSSSDSKKDGAVSLFPQRNHRHNRHLTPNSAVTAATVLAFNRHGTYLAMGYASGDIWLYNFTTRQFFVTLLVHVRVAVSSLAWSSSGQTLYSADVEGQLACWTLPTLLLHTCDTISPAWSVSIPGTTTSSPSHSGKNSCMMSSSSYFETRRCPARALVR